MRHRRHGAPKRVLAAALAELERGGIAVLAASPTVASAPLGPSRRTYANAAALVETSLDPPAVLDLLQAIEHRFGRRRRGQRWAARVLDLDLIAWSGGAWHDASLTLPHPRFRNRAFVLGPASALTPLWRDPLTGLTLAQLHRRLTRPRALPR
jgi:2-amino-4-hydroxy-6-hydroxymethyldihydropteridine diphosphokinase